MTVVTEVVELGQMYSSLITGSGTIPIGHSPATVLPKEEGNIFAASHPKDPPVNPIWLRSKLLWRQTSASTPELMIEPLGYGLSHRHRCLNI